ncbi:DolP-mannose mannosyltransferase [Halobacterium yunchengense]|uniref:DolP-mannose mannosyltransferase n=1 Tax=Halobacterium yunchengense TaxID=3108497 RepID=UPI00300B1470
MRRRLADLLGDASVLGDADASAFVERVDARWRTVLVALAVVVVGGSTAVLFAHDPFYVSADSALFQHAGWYVGQGAVLYVDVWDLKPPLIYAVTATLAFVARGDVAALHVLSVLVSVAAVVGGVAYTGRTVYRLTGDGFAAVVAGTSLFALASLYAFPYAGVRPKYFAFLCGAAALSYAVADRHLAAGVAAALAAGFWQLGAGVAVVVVAVALQRGGPRAALRTTASGLAVATVVVSPFVLTGTAVPLFVEVVLAPLYGVERSTVPARLLALVVEVGYGVGLVPLAAYGWWRGVRADRQRYWWVAAGGAAYCLQVLLEFQGAIELVLVFVFLALGVGVLVAESPSPDRRLAVAAVVVVLVASGAVWQATPAAPGKPQAAALHDEFDVPDYAALPPDPPGVPPMDRIYWQRQTPDTCHYRLGDKQKHFERATGGNLTKSTCGQWPFEREPLPWLVDRVV